MFLSGQHRFTATSVFSVLRAAVFIRFRDISIPVQRSYKSLFTENSAATQQHSKA